MADDGSFYAEIPVCNGVYANAATLEECREQLAEEIEEWILFCVYKNLPLPAVDGIELTIKAKNRPNTTTATQSGETRRGYRPFEKGYQLVDTAQDSQNEQSTQKLPKLPAGGTGQTPPRATRPRQNGARPE